MRINKINNQIQEKKQKNRPSFGIKLIPYHHNNEITKAISDPPSSLNVVLGLLKTRYKDCDYTCRYSLFKEMTSEKLKYLYSSVVEHMESFKKMNVLFQHINEINKKHNGIIEISDEIKEKLVSKTSYLTFKGIDIPTIGKKIEDMIENLPQKEKFKITMSYDDRDIREILIANLILKESKEPLDYGRNYFKVNIFENKIKPYLDYPEEGGNAEIFYRLTTDLSFNPEMISKTQNYANDLLIPGYIYK